MSSATQIHVYVSISGQRFLVSRGRLVLFGGEAITAITSDTWEWDGTNWTNRTPAAPAPSPSERELHAMAYDAARGRVVLFGGDSGTGILSDTWALSSDSPPVLSRISLTASPGSAPGAFVTQRVNLTAAASDPDNDFLDLTWTQTSGPTVALTGADSSVASFQPTTPATYGFSVSAFDGREGWAIASGFVTVRPNHTPNVSAITTSTSCCADVVLAPLASDPDGDTLTYAWTQSGGTEHVTTLTVTPSVLAAYRTGLTYEWTQLGGPAIDVSGSRPAVATGPLATPGDYRFQLVVLDPAGRKSVPDTVGFHVRAIGSPGPVLRLDATDASDAESAQGIDPSDLSSRSVPLRVTAETGVRLTASVEDSAVPCRAAIFPGSQRTSRWSPGRPISSAYPNAARSPCPRRVREMVCVSTPVGDRRILLPG